VPAETFGPYVGQAGDSSLFVWAATDAAGKRSFYSASAGFDAVLKSEPRRIADAASELGVVNVRALGTQSNAASAAFVIVSTEKQATGDALDVLFLTQKGDVVGKSVRVAESASAVLWVEAMPLPAGVLILWAAESGKRAEIFGAELSQTGQLKDKPQSLAKEVGAWQAQPFATGAALGIVRASKNARGVGAVEVVFVGANAKPSATTFVSKDETARYDFDMVKIGERLLLVWSDQRGVESRVYSAAVDGPQKIAVPPAPATPAWGEQSVVRLVAPAAKTDRAYLVWESLGETHAGRVFDIAGIGTDARVLKDRARLEYVRTDGTMPEFAPTSKGLSALTIASLCARGFECENAAIAPTYVAFDESLRVTASEPLRLDALDGKTATLAWGLSCFEERCIALSALNDAPAPVFVTRLEHKSDGFRPAGSSVERGAVPRAIENEALASTEPLAQISVTSVAGQTLVGWITEFDPTTPWQRLSTPAADGRFEPLRARIDLRAYSATPPFAPLLLTQNLSLRAHSIAGLALATPEPPKAEVVAAWSGLDRAQPQVFLTTLTKDGIKSAQRMLTRKNGGLSDIALAPATDGYFVAWVDERDADPELYVTKINRALTRVSPERRITNVKGNAADVQLFNQNGGAVVVWADARDAQQAGWADLFAVRLRATDAAVEGNEVRLTATRAHSFGVVGSKLADGVALAFLEGSDESATNGAPSLGLGVLKASAEWLQAPLLLPIVEGTPAAVGLECAGDTCHVAFTVDLGGRGEVRGFSWKPGSKPGPIRRLVSLSTVSPVSVQPVIRGKHVYYADTTNDRQGRVRRLTVDWE
jgi:hypothetical protein